LAKIPKEIFDLTLNLGAGEVAGCLEQLHEGEVKVEGGNDPAHPGVQTQGFFFHRVQGPHIRGWVRLREVRHNDPIWRSSVGRDVAKFRRSQNDPHPPPPKTISRKVPKHTFWIITR
jgi:hypothetical protein